MRLALSVAHAARAIGVSRRGLYLMIARGDLTTVKLGRRRLVPVIELERLIRGNGRRRHRVRTS